ncbi:MAG: NAD(P)-dependent alcohol dehydrogenase [Nitriliruptorales bacterium]|nr:NAD(P)-dependent alcohol dehydrogenase [Nitriliruptorales bacterium]
MRAVVQSAYGDPAEVLEVGEVDRPSVGDDEVLVRVRAASVHPDVWHVVTGLPRVLRVMGSGVLAPNEQVPGTDMAGEVEAVGAAVTRFQPGDAVFGETIRGMQWRNGGAFAEYVATTEDALAPKPPDVSFEQAATVPTAGIIALHNLPDLDALPDGHRVLVNGAGGGVGAIALQLAKAAGAHVTAVDHSDKLDLLRQLGADRVVDYTTDDVTRIDATFDLVFDVAGNHRYPAYRHVLEPDGGYVLIGHDHFGRVGRRWLGSIPTMVGLMARSVSDRRLSLKFDNPDRPAAMQRLHAGLASGALTPVVAEAFPLEAAAEALKMLASGRAVGRIVVVP